MTTTLVRHPLRTSLSMTSGHETITPLDGDDQRRPFAYALATYATDLDHSEIQEDPGHYNEQAQVWEIPGGGYTMGVYTSTTTGGSCGCDCVTDDACF